MKISFGLFINGDIYYVFKKNEGEFIVVNIIFSEMKFIIIIDISWIMMNLFVIWGWG